jgi:pimeloyl-ACP methyl ester carboxylesterase
MLINFKGAKTYIGTGGKNLDNSKTTICFIHGAGQNHLSFIQQSRFFANKGYSVIVPDMPGHGLSEGKPCKSIKEIAKWVYDLLKTLDVNKIIILGHSQGCLVALELNRLYPSFLNGVIFVAGSNEIPVNQFLLDLSLSDEQKASNMMVTWGHGIDGDMSINNWPGHSHYGEGNNVMKMNKPKSLNCDLNACNNYKDGIDAAKSINIPALAVLAKNDQMTPLKSGQKFVELIKKCETHVLDCGHFLQTERPKVLNSLILSYLLKL